DTDAEVDVQDGQLASDRARAEPLQLGDTVSTEALPPVIDEHIAYCVDEVIVVVQNEHRPRHGFRLGFGRQGCNGASMELASRASKSLRQHELERSCRESRVAELRQRVPHANPVAPLGGGAATGPAAPSIATQ